MRRQLTVEADGGSRGNPGVAGYGALVRDDGTREVLAERAAPLGLASNNVAEYTGLIEGLRAAISIDPTASINVRMDSKLVVEQMSGRWKIKHEDMRRLASEAREIVRQIQSAGGTVSFTWIPREKNKHADALSNKGMDGQTVTINRGAGADVGDAGETEPSGAVSSAGGSPSAVGRAQLLAAAGGGLDLAEEVMDALPPETEPSFVSTRIVLVRHGITDYTQTHRLDGRGGANPPLNEIGRRQAQAAAEAVAALLAGQPDRSISLVTSSLARAQQTGQAIADALEVTPVEDRDWDEQSFGEWDGARILDLSREHATDLMRMRNDEDFACPGGESERELEKRVGAALDRAIARGGVVVVATHRKPILAVMRRLLRFPLESIWTIASAPASLTAVEVWPDGAASISFTNRTHHLTGDLSAG